MTEAKAEDWMSKSEGDVKSDDPMERLLAYASHGDYPVVHRDTFAEIRDGWQGARGTIRAFKAKIELLEAALSNARGSEG